MEHIPDTSYQAFHERLITVSEDTRQTLDGTLPELQIVSDTELVIDEKKLMLRGAQIYACNALLDATEPRTGVQMREAYNFKLSDAAFNIAMQKLLGEFNEITDTPIVKVDKVKPPKGRSVPTYTLMAGVVDKRKDELLGVRFFNEVEYEGIQPERDKSGYIAFRGPAYRERVFSSMMKEIASHPSVQSAFTHYLEGHYTGRSNERRLGSFVGYPELDEEVELELVHAVDRGLTDFVEGGKDEEKQINAANAVFRLYMHNAKLVANYAASFSTNETSRYHELYQEGSTGLMIAIAQTGTNNLKGRFYYSAGWHIRNAMIGWLRNADDLSPKRYEQKRDLRMIKDVADQLQLNGQQQTIDAFSEATGFSPKKVVALLNSATNFVSLEAPIEGAENLTHGSSIAEWALDDALEALYMQDDIDTLFASQELTDKEKVTLSLQFGVYRSMLAGAEMAFRGHGVVFIYPYSEEDFCNLQQKIKSLQSLDEFFDLASGTLWRVSSEALRKARHVLKNANYNVN